MDCYQYNRKIAVVCGLIKIPSRRTFDRRLKAISTDIKERISTIGHLFVAIEGLVDLSIIAVVDSTLLKSNGHVWHKSSMKKGVVPRSGIDTDARWWGYSLAKGWIFGYKLHLTCTTGKIVLPLTVDVTTAMPFSICFQTLQKIFLYILEIHDLFIYANWYSVPDNKMYVPLTSSSSSSSVFSLPYVLYMIADPGYDDKKLYEYSKKDLYRSGLSC